MAPTIEQIMLGVETRLKTITGLRAEEYVPDSINPPCAIVGVPPVEYHATFGNGHMKLPCTVTVLVSAALDRQGQLKLAGYVNPTGATSIKAAIEGDSTLGGVVSDCKVMSFRPLGIEEVGVVGYYGGVFDLLIVATGV